MTGEVTDGGSRAVSIQLLADNPQLMHAVGEIRWREWGHAPETDNPYDFVDAQLRVDWWVDATVRESGREDLPVTWVVVDEGEVMGAVGLGEFDIDERRDRTPWVLGMIVEDRHRGAGIGRQLLTHLEGWARHRGYEKIWVATGDPAADFYRKCGWELTETIDRASGEIVKVLMRRL